MSAANCEVNEVVEATSISPIIQGQILITDEEQPTSYSDCNVNDEDKSLTSITSNNIRS